MPIRIKRGVYFFLNPSLSLIQPFSKFFPVRSVALSIQRVSFRIMRKLDLHCSPLKTVYANNRQSGVSSEINLKLWSRMMLVIFLDLLGVDLEAMLKHFRLAAVSLTEKS